MSCVKVATMVQGFPSQSRTLPLRPSLSHMPCHNRVWANTVLVNSPSTPTPITCSPISTSSLSPPYSSFPSSYSSSSSSSLSSATIPGKSPSPLSLSGLSRFPTPPSRGHASEIIRGLYISDLTFAENPSLLSSYRITHIISVLPETVATPPPHVLPNQPKRLQIKVEDFPFAELAAHLPVTTMFIREALHPRTNAHAQYDFETETATENRVLVHCAEGISRSVSVVAAYLMSLYGWNPDQAIAFIKQRRGVANPNFGFVQQLYEYGRDVLAQRNPIPTSPASTFSSGAGGAATFMSPV